MNAQEPVEKTTAIPTYYYLRTTAEKERYIRSAVDESPHKIAIVSLKDHYRGGDDHKPDQLVAVWYDENNKLVFSKVPQIGTDSKFEGKEFGAFKTVEATPLDFTAKYGPQAGATKAELFKAELQRSPDDMGKAIEKVDSNFGINLKDLLQGAWEKLKAANPDAAEFLAKLLLKHLFGINEVEGSAVDVVSKLMESGPDVILPKTFVVTALQTAWEEFEQAYPLPAEAVAEHLANTYRPPDLPNWGSYSFQVKSGIAIIVDKLAPTPSAWASENSTRAYNPERGTWVDAGKHIAPAQEKVDGDESTGRHGDPSDGLMGRHRDAADDYMEMIKAAVDASPTKVAVIGVTRDAGASKIDFLNADKFDHVLVAYYDHDKKAYVIAEMRFSPDARNPLFGSQNSPVTLEKIVKDYYTRYVAIPLKLTPEQDAQFRASLLKNQDGKYSFSTEQGYTCASLVVKALIDAKVWDWKETGEAFVVKLMAVLAKAGLNVILPGTVIAWAAGKGGTVYDSKTYSPATADKGDAADKPVAPAKADATDKPATAPKPAATDAVPLAALGAASTLKASPPVDSDKTEPDADVDTDGEIDGETGSLQPIVGWVENPSSPKTALPETSATLETLAAAPKNEDARTDDAAEQGETDDDEEDPQEQVALASDDEDAPSDDDDAQQPAADDDAEASQEQVALASDDEDAPSDDDAAQQPATDDDEDASQEEVAIASDREDTPTDDAAVMETASAQAATDPDDGFSFSAFPKPVTPADVVKEVMPAEQVSHEDIPGSGTLESETAPPDAGSEDVGNAAPSKEPVVHHSDLAP
jgi:hypothetical protein